MPARTPTNTELSSSYPLASSNIESIDFLEAVINYNMKNEKSIPIVFSSTCATYGYPQNLPISEEENQKPINPYGWSKFFVERLLKDFGRSYGLKSVIFRYFNAAGADPEGDTGEDHNPETHLIPLIFEVISGKKEILEIFGDDYPTKDGTCIRDYIHINDICSAIKKSIYYLKKNNQKFEIINIGSSTKKTNFEILNQIKKITKVENQFHVVKRRKGDADFLTCSIKKAKKTLNWKPLFSNIDKIINDEIKWVKYLLKNKKFRRFKNYI